MTTPNNNTEWFATPDPEPEKRQARDGQSLRFECTCCGNCCSGPPGYVLINESEIRALAARLGVSRMRFLAEYTHTSPEGISINERTVPLPGKPRNLDCVFLDRETVPGKAVCSVYEDRPGQCKTWPFWPSNLKSRAAWERAAKTCPGIDRGRRYDLVQIRIARDAVNI